MRLYIYCLPNNGDELDTLETDEEELGTRGAAAYDNIKDLEGEIVQKSMEASLQNTSMIASSGEEVVDWDNPGTNAQIQRSHDMQYSS